MRNLSGILIIWKCLFYLAFSSFIVVSKLYCSIVSKNTTFWQRLKRLTCVVLFCFVFLRGLSNKVGFRRCLKLFWLSYVNVYMGFCEALVNNPAKMSFHLASWVFPKSFLDNSPWKVNKCYVFFPSNFDWISNCLGTSEPLEVSIYIFPLIDDVMTGYIGPYEEAVRNCKITQEIEQKYRKYY